MASLSSLSLLTLLLTLSLSSTLSSATSHHRHHHHHGNTNSPQPQDLLHSACSHARYPTVCVRTLSTYPATTPRDLAQASVHVALHRARKVSTFLHSSQVGSTKRTRSAIGDCVEQLSDSVDELSQTLAELKHLRGETLSWQLSNAETWVSAALTNEDTCLDGFDEIDGKIKDDVRRKITNVARVTSNALYMINRLDKSRGRG